MNATQGSEVLSGENSGKLCNVYSLPRLSDEDEVEPESVGMSPPSVTVSKDSSFWSMQVSARIWVICCATFVYTSKRLMVTNFYHYPLTITFRFYAVSTVVYFALYWFLSKSARTRKITQASSQIPRWEEKCNYRTLVAVAPAAATAAISMPLLMEGLLHMPSLAVVVMLFPLAYITEASILTFHGAVPSISFSSEIICATFLSAAILYNEYRLMVPGLVFTILGVLSAGVSRALLYFACSKEEMLKTNICHIFSCMTLILGLLSTGFWLSQVERFSRVYQHSVLDASAYINIISSVGASLSILSGTATFSPVSLLAPSISFSRELLPPSSIFAAALSSGLVMIASSVTFPVSYVSPLQLVLFIVSASLSIIFSTRAQAAVLGQTARYELVLDTIPVESAHIENAGSRKAKIVFKGGIAFALALLAAWIFYSTNSLSINNLPALHPNLDNTFASPPNARFDIVVSMYDEDPLSISSLLTSIRSTTPLHTLQPRLIIYTKNATASLPHIKEITGASTVGRLPNRGREGGTYLHHIVHKWDELAEQTMFIQAHAHNERELLPRINDFLVPRTGMLSLGFAGVTCSSASCTDRFGWVDDTGLLPRIYRMIHNSTSTGPVLLSYKGQFVASARRIRGVPKEIYGYLLDAMMAGEGEGWAHDPSFVGDNPDSPDAPFLGYAVERLWNMLLQCSDLKVAALCPSLLSGWRVGGEVGDCQCLDPE